MDGAALDCGIRPADWYTTADNAGTVSVSLRVGAGLHPVASVAVDAFGSCRLPTYVGIAAVLRCSLLFSATTYSRCSPPVDPGERVDPGRVRGVAVLVGAVAQRRMLTGHCRELADRQVQRVRR